MEDWKTIYNCDKLIIVVTEFYLRAWHRESIARLLWIYCDNSGTIFFFKNDKYSWDAKHMKFKYLLVKEEMEKQKVSFEHVSTNLMIYVN